ncbi:MAG TPA: hypothetical protein VFH95_05730 [Candidatus Kapabacteria bacterium]|nr:hypothetical protein [Candidatus Kapabacteria bacterium]
MSRSIAISIVCLASCFGMDAYAQNPASAADSGGYQTPADSMHTFDSAYRARKALLDQWVHEQNQGATPQEDFISVYAGYGGYLQILPRDLNQLFSERALRPASDQAGDRNSYQTVDRAIILSGQAQLAETWGIYFEYDLVEKWFNTSVDITSPAPYNIAGAVEELDLTEHSFVVGGMYIFYSGPFYRLRASGGMGGVVALTSETESIGNAARSASAAGYQVNFDLLNDFRVAPSVSFTIDLLARSVTTGELKTSGGQTLNAAFGKGDPSRITLQPNASNVVYGAAAGLVFYF